jgi:aspartokinase
VQAVVSEKQVERIRLKGADVHTTFKQAVELLESEHVPIKEVNVTELTVNGKNSTASFVVSTNNIYSWEQVKSLLQEKLRKNIEFDADLAALSLIGEGLNRNNLTLLETIDLLSDNQISLFGITTTSFRISLLVPRDKIEKSIELCHTHWVANKA